MSVVYTLLALLAFVVLTVGTAVFVAAEFSLTALERSTVDSNARTGGRRDHLVQRAHLDPIVADQMPQDALLEGKSFLIIDLEIAAGGARRQGVGAHLDDHGP